ncbi:hypothetical protein GCM10007919_05570 [Rhizobium indigoferae]|nr:hypothetical protein GCM10007919_05570 [Rhizobium indigoferae]
MWDCRLCEQDGRANVHIKHGLQVGECQIRSHAGGSDARTVDEDIKPSECIDRLADGATDGVRVGTIGLNGKPATAFFLDSLDHRCSPVGRAMIREGDVRAILGKRNSDRGPYSSRATVHQGAFSR